MPCLISILEISGVEAGVQAHAQKIWFVKNLGKIPKNSGTEVLTLLSDQ